MRLQNIFLWLHIHCGRTTLCTFGFYSLLHVVHKGFWRLTEEWLCLWSPDNTSICCGFWQGTLPKRWLSTQHLSGYFPDYLKQPKPHSASLPPHTFHAHPHNSPTLCWSLVSCGHNWLDVAWLRRCLTCSSVPHNNDESFPGARRGGSRPCPALYRRLMCRRLETSSFVQLLGTAEETQGLT